MAVLAIAAGGIALFAWRQPEVTPAIRGERIAQRMGCFGCHGPGGLGGVTDLTSSAGTVPGWDSGTAPMYVKTREDIREWIVRGQLQNMDRRGIPEALIPMPAYGPLLSEREVEDLVEYFIAVSGWAPKMPEPAYEGWRICDRVGCFGCHGPSGMGGVPNPGSFKGHIPAWDGAEFEELVRDEKELREWILDGKIRRLWENAAARHFLEGQIIQMPPYREHLSDLELKHIVAYIEWLRKKQ